MKKKKDNNTYPNTVITYFINLNKEIEKKERWSIQKVV